MATQSLGSTSSVTTSISPILSTPVESQSATGSATQSTEGQKIPIFYNIPQGKFQAKTDIPPIIAYIGEDAKNSDTFEFFDAEQELGDDFTEGTFAGQEEANLNEVEDDPIGDIYNDLPPDVGEPASVATSPVSGGPAVGSKLLNKSGKYYFLVNPSNGLAGHRLRNVITDLQKYLNANGYTGAKIGNNGITRDLVASTYPSSPARAVASLHGAGLAIDLTFNIPGKKWTGIGDNGNLSSDTALTKVIARWVASQGDLTWGAEWGKSKPPDGFVQDRGIIEYHHFEIKASKISEYWKPFEKELKDLGFDYTKMNRTGKGSEMYKLNQVLLKSVNVTGIA